MVSSAEDKLARFQPLGAYDWPAMPTEHAMRAMFRRVSRRFTSDDNKPFIADDRLRRTRLSQPDEFDTPACGLLRLELDATLGPWARQTRPDSWLKLVVLPSCDRSGLVQDWAVRHQHQVLAPPGRGELLRAQDRPPLPSLDGPGVLVIPRLERWYLRHRNGLTWIRALLVALDRLQRHCVIGCDSWAWQFLRKAAVADFMLPTGITFQAFDAARVHRWLSDLVQQRSAASITFRSAGSGEKLLSLGEDLGRPHNYFQQLAASSLGIPWVAWQLWNRSLRSRIEGPEADDGAAPADGDDQTMWVSALEEFSLPGRHHEDALLILQAILLHDSLSIEEIGLVVPSPDVLPMVAALANAGLVERSAGEVRCRPAAYPSIRQALSTAGMPMDEL